MNTIFSKCTVKVPFIHSSKVWQFLHLRNNIYSRVTFFCSGAVQNVVDVLQLTSKFSFRNCEKLKLIHKVDIVSQSFRLLTTSRNRCWQCNAVVTERDLVCLTCGCVQEPRQNLNNFEIFKETPHFDVDVKILTIKFRRLQNLLHPDKFATRSEKEKKYSMEQSSRVNRAYQTLYHPLERGLYLLDLYGKPLLEGEITMSNDFLEDIVEINESIMESKTAEAIEAIRNTNNARLEVLFAELAQAFKEKNVERAREILAKLKYFVSIDTQIRKIEDEFGISRDD